MKNLYQIIRIDLLTFFISGSLTFFISGCNSDSDDNTTACECEAESYIYTNDIAAPSIPTGSISNYANDGDFTADAACHADMRLRFYWEDSIRASTPEVPPLIPSFETPLGYFPPSSFKTTQNVVYNHSVGGNIYQYVHEYWISEAQDKDEPQGTSYAVRWTYDTSSPISVGRVKIFANLRNRVYDANEYARDEDESCFD